MAKNKTQGARTDALIVKLIAESVINQTFANLNYYRAKALEDILKSKLDIDFTEEDIEAVMNKNAEEYKAAVAEEYKNIMADQDFVLENLKKFYEGAAKMSADYEKYLKENEE